MLEGSEAKKIRARILAKLTAQNELLLVADTIRMSSSSTINTTGRKN
ncbi:unnamed protein product [Haemonchus placei]|uniref:Transposase n=1 Tax=Haemonchus placei TaxID=6290 RepID=A0A0N4WEZ6_HAEPC|nr:unnamed protein product [Haemonchus placei]